MESLITNLKAVERARKEQQPILERLAQSNNNSEEEEEEQSDDAKEALREQYERAYRLAQQEQRAADAARDQVLRLLAVQQEQRTNRRRRSREREREREGSSSSNSNINSNSSSSSNSKDDTDRDRLPLRGNQRRDHPPNIAASAQPPPPSASSRRSVDGSAQGETTAIGKGSLVAARVAPAGAASEEWILATVLSYNSEKNRYTVQDDDLESPVRPTYVLSPRQVILVTSEIGGTALGATSSRRRLWDRSRNPEMPRGQRVFALYPRTTAFYQGTVVVPPSLNASGDADPSTNPMYRLLFDDDDGLELDVPAHFVLPVPRQQ
ncbi:hypothetical protein EV175_001267 [Coemansia sp. RSA 1933]|nr:hypothetical protein EV175_001267 [Coemansia sp. RSA 1933]